MSEGIQRRNVNRGFQQLRLWQDAVDLCVMTCVSVKGWPFEMKKVAGQQIASADSVHRNIAEVYARKSISEYLQFLNYARGSIAETASGLLACRQAGQMCESTCEDLDALAFKLENGLLRLVESLERKRNQGDWEDSLIVRESNESYGWPYFFVPIFHHSNLPPFL